MKQSAKTNVLIFVIAAVLSIGTVAVTIPLKNTYIHIIWSFVNERGLFPYLSIFSGYVCILALLCIWHGTTKPDRRLNMLVLFSALPLMFGIAGTIQGYHMLTVDICDMFTDLPSQMIGQVPTNIRRGIRAAWDPAILGMIVSAINYVGIGLLKHKMKSVQQAGPASPPQGVGSADP